MPTVNNDWSLIYKYCWTKPIYSSYSFPYSAFLSHHVDTAWWISDKYLYATRKCKHAAIPGSMMFVGSGSYERSIAARKLSFTPHARADLLDNFLSQVTGRPVELEASSSSSRMPIVWRSSRDLCFFSEESDAISDDSSAAIKQKCCNQFKLVL